MNEKADELSHLIRSVFPHQHIVGISATRSLEMVIGLIAILKAGKAYLPLDPTYPASRLTEIIKGAGLTSCVAVSEEHDFFASLDLKLLASDKKQQLHEIIESTQSPLAYILYTSGSTGKPKGVSMGHQALMNLLDWQNANSKADAQTKTLQFAPLTFDVSFQEIFATLTTGGTLTMIEDDLRLDPYRLLEFIEEQRINRLFLPFIALQQLTEVAGSNNFFPTSLKEIMTAGEQLKITPQVKRFFSNIPGCTLYNQYGPTEAHVVSSLTLEGDPSHWPSLPTIGNAIQNTELLVLDEKLNVLPSSEVGELHISGICLADGYLHNELLTNEKFVSWSHPVDGIKKIYKTGDLVRTLSDGTLEFLGRKDDQVKIRGHRVELGEIEVLLNKLDGIEQAVVTVREDTPDHKKLVAYLVSTHNKIDNNAARQSLQKLLPDYMIPSAFVWLKSLPKTSSGKIDRKALPRPVTERPELNSLFVAPVSEIEKNIASIWCELLQIDSIGSEDNFFDLGGNSLLAVKSVVELKQRYHYILPVTRLYQHPTVKSIATYFSSTANTSVPIEQPKKGNGDVAVIGMAGRFPGADTIEELWQILKDGKETIRFFTDEELHPSVSAKTRGDQNYVKARGVLNHAEKFDANFFGINPKVASLMDPQQRIFLEIAWEVLEQTGHLPEKYSGKIGVFAGSGNNTYYLNNVLPNKSLIESVGAFQVMTVNEKDYLATRVAYQLNLKGPAVSVYSGCSTSLLAIAQATESIRNGNCQVALAGGVAIHAPVNSGQYYEEGAMFSPDGHCRPFDKDAKGTVFSDGAGIVLLKSMEDAITDGDVIYGVIKGVGYNNDGAGKASFTAPSAEGQASAIQQAIKDAGIKARSISYIEAHGTATPIGDPIEIEGLQLAFGPQEISQFCAVGSLKSNLGHLTAAAGVAGLIKTILALHHRQIPASLHYKEANSNIDFQNSPFYVNTSHRNWDSDGKRVAGVSSFGVGGTNVHVILEEYENATIHTSNGHPFTLVNWSARTVKSRDEFAQSLVEFINENPDKAFQDIAYTLQSTKAAFNQRRFVIANNPAEFAQDALKNLSPGNSIHLREKIEAVAFLFPGQGSQYAGMGKELYEIEPAFRKAVDDCAAILHKHMQADIREIIFNVPEEKVKNPINNTRYTQPALFTIEYALANLWISWGVRPTVTAGHSIGEYIAAHLAGIFSLEDALILVVHRGRLMSEAAEGRMLSVPCGEDQLKQMMPAELSIAAINTVKSCVVSGPAEIVGRFAESLKAKGIASRLLNTSHAFHSPMMDEIVNPFLQIVRKVQMSVPRIPVISTVTGKILSDNEATDPGYWANQLRATVRFADAINTICAEQKKILLEVGPGNVISNLARQQFRETPVVTISGLLKNHKTQSEYYSMLESLGVLWLNGIEPNWNALYTGQQTNRLRLPAYSFDRQAYWVEAQPEAIPEINKTNISLARTVAAVPEKIDMRKSKLIPQILQILEDASGIETQSVSNDVHFMELGLDSLSLTQVSLSLKKKFNVPISFRQLVEELNTVDEVAAFIDSKLPAETIKIESPSYSEDSVATNQSTIALQPAQNDTVLSLISQQIALLSKQVALLQNGNGVPVKVNTAPPAVTTSQLSPEEEAEIRKPFGATARIQKQSQKVDDTQHTFIKDFIERYNAKTAASKAYTQQHRSSMADPRVVSGFQPLIKEMVYPIVVNRSKGSRLWDIDGNEYIDVLNGFGSNLLGHQHETIKAAIQDQIDKGYEIGPQHELAGDVCSLICEFTNFDRAALCNTGSEAVLGAIRIARTVTGRSTIVSFNGSYHGIIDEVIVRGTKKLKSFPAAPGIMPEAVHNILVLDYGTEESLQIIRERAHELAAVLVEPVQSRRPEFLPVSFLRELREITRAFGTVLIFDEVITGFRMHAGGVQSMLDIKADLGTYGKVVAGGMPIGVIAGRQEFMDALDGGHWQYGDDSVPEAGVTYFAGTFVRHPLALAAAKASLTYMKQKGSALQEGINAKTKRLANSLNQTCERYALPLYVAQFGSLWKCKFKSEIPFGETLFSLLRYKGIHIWDLFPCFITEAHTNEDIDSIIKKFNEAVHELIEAGIFPSNRNQKSLSAKHQIQQDAPIDGAKIGWDDIGNPAWFISDPERPGKFLQIVFNEN